MMEINSNQPLFDNALQHLDAVADELSKGYLSIFAGAGTSVGSGYSDWKQLMYPIINQLGLNSNIDLTKAAQYYENEYGRHGINLLVNEEFSKAESKENKTLDRLTDLPVQSVWTTNYDTLLEDTYIKKGKIVDVKVRQEQFKYHTPNCDITIYKMHGDKNYPDDVVITKNDYETYDMEREVFTKALSVELITNTFLFIGFSFSDPNLDRIISVVRHTFEHKAPKNHYCFMKRVCKSDPIYAVSGVEQFNQDYNYQVLRIRDMRKYGIQTILVDDFSQIDDMLYYIKYKYISNCVFISGSFTGNLTLNMPEAKLIECLSQKLVENKFHIFSGFGTNVGNYLILGAYKGLQKFGIHNIEKAITIYPLVSLCEPTNPFSASLEEMRKSMIDSCGTFISMFGKTYFNSDDEIIDGLIFDKKTIKYSHVGSAYDTEEREKAQEIVCNLKNDGMIKEYRIALDLDKIIIPWGFTGGTAKYIQHFEERRTNSYINDKLTCAFPNDTDLINEDCARLVDRTISLIKQLQLDKTRILENRLLQRMSAKSVSHRAFLSFHYNESRLTARKIRSLLLGSNKYVVTEEEQVHFNNEKTIREWIDAKLIDTDITILIWAENIFQSNYVKYEISKSIERLNAFVIINDSEHTQNEEIINRIREFASIPSTIPNEYFAFGKSDSTIVELTDILDCAIGNKNKLISRQINGDI